MGHSSSESPVAVSPPVKAAHPLAVQAGVSTSARAARQVLVVVAAEQEVGAATSAKVAPLPAAGPSEDNLAALEKE